MGLLLFLIGFPLLVAFLVLAAKNDRLRGGVITLATVVLCAASILLLFDNFHRPPQLFSAEFPGVEKIMLGLEILLGAYIFFLSLKFKQYMVASLVTLQVLIMVVCELTFGASVKVDYNLFVDNLSVIMALIIGIIGSLICLYSVGYMKRLHEEHHKEIPDRRPFFSFILFVFLAAMFGVVFANNLVWLYFFWEITTLCSFFLIAYKQDEISWKNAFLALKYNLLGGLGFALALAYLMYTPKVIEMDKVLALGKASVMIPVALICFAGLTKSAQMPFSSWLLGAMVAPTPVSALLHSSTMVKAGVYILLKFATVLQGTLVGGMLALVGCLTFVLASFIAITQSDAKRVLAYSTVANLGLIVMCAGIGSYEAVWAGVFLIIFHAIAKGLLFLCVGTTEHNIHSRNIEDMGGLILRLPKIAVMMQIGMAGMFLAPFGMLISKWAVLKALVVSPYMAMVFLLAVGSSATLFFWVKWMGKLITVMGPQENVEKGVTVSEWTPLYILAGLTIVVCAIFPLISTHLVEVYLINIYNTTVMVMSQGNTLIMLLMMVMVLLFPLTFLNYGKNVRVTDAYLGGANVQGSTQFTGSTGDVTDLETKNYYLENIFGESKLIKVGAILTIISILVMVVVPWV